jgi:6-phosphogluconate dehydrogenase (decarboxylating)
MFRNNFGRILVGISAAVASSAVLSFGRADALWVVLMIPTVMMLPVLALGALTRHHHAAVVAAYAVAWLLVPLGIWMGQASVVLAGIDLGAAMILLFAASVLRDAPVRRLARIAIATGGIHFVLAAVAGSLPGVTVSLSLFVGGIAWLVESADASLVTA